MYTQLKNYQLWQDGEITIAPEEIMSFLLTAKDISKIRVNHMTSEISQYNNFAKSTERIQIKQDLKPLSYDWNIPDHYKELNISKVLVNKLHEEFNQNDFSELEKEERLTRVANELILYQKNNLINALKTIIYVINTFDEQNIIWGVGRGSSVSSYILYLLNVHDIDSIKYKLHIEEFIS